jgi:hypothetical protein
MAKKNQNTFEKRRRDMEKKMRAEDKRKKRLKRKVEAESNGAHASESTTSEDRASIS